jgi:RimJ/RimL family protein N-acetyltransferase
MPQVSLRKVTQTDKKYFAKWWRDKDLLKQTSGQLKKILDSEVEKYFSQILKADGHYIIVGNKKVVGHISLEKRRSGWYETQIVIGQKNAQGKGYGTAAIKTLLHKAIGAGISKVYLEVRPVNARAIHVYEKSGFKLAGVKKYPQNKSLPQTLKMVFDKK